MELTTDYHELGAVGSAQHWKKAAFLTVSTLAVLALVQVPSAGVSTSVRQEPQWYDGIDTIKVFSPGDAVEKFALDLYNETTGCDKTGEFSTVRLAMLLRPGTYSDTIAVGYYTSLIGVGASADSVVVQSFYTMNKNCGLDGNPLGCCDGHCGDGLTNFWRSVEGVATTSNVTWAASQAAPLRRIHVGGSLALAEKRGGAVSGGFVADTVVDHELVMGLQQQHLIRSSWLHGGEVGTYMNYVFLGVQGAPPPAENGRVSVKETTPRVAAKPFLVEADDGQWSIVVPPLAVDTRGPLPTGEVRIPMADVFVARAGDDAASINAGIVGKRALLLTPAVYSLTGSISISSAGFVVLGLGFPTLVATAGRSALRVTADAVRVSGVLLEAGTSLDHGPTGPTEPLLRWVGSGGVGNDVFTRSGAFRYATEHKPSCERTRADVHVAIEGDDVTLDNTWAWHADHDDCDGRSDTSLALHGLVVTGADVVAIGLQVEHQMEDLVVWSGERGQVYMFQSELPYKYASFKALGYHVLAGVKEHTVLGGGVYGIGNMYPIPVGIKLPATAKASNLFIWAIAAAPAYLPDYSRFGSVVCTTDASGGETCYRGACDFVACFQVALAASSTTTMTTTMTTTTTTTTTATATTAAAALAMPEASAKVAAKATAASEPPRPSHVPPSGSWRGVSLGGWLVMEINPSKVSSASSSADVRPSWMFDQIEADSELDFVIQMRRARGDAVAIATMRNHWARYLDEGMLDTAVALGVNAVRIPVGYWITEPPVGGSSPYDYGFSNEGFVTGGLNHLRAMLPKLKARGITALLDIHSLPCGQACVSNGLSCDAPLAFAASNDSTPGVPVGDIPRCRGGGSVAESGVYPTSRGPGTTWGDVAVESVANLARWIASLPADVASVIGALQVANEPALNSPGYLAAVQHFYRRAIVATRAVLPTLPLVLNFIYPNDKGLDIFMNELQREPWGGALVLDVHWYLNWAGDFVAGGETAEENPDKSVRAWDKIHSRACHSPAMTWNWCSAYGNDIPVVLGEWSLASNHDAPLDLSDAATASELRQMYEEQLAVYTFGKAWANQSNAPLVGHFFWTLRMGSGWDPRPTDEHPHGRQVGASSAAKSLDGYPFRVWSLLELEAHGIATPMTGADKKACEGIPEPS